MPELELNEFEKTLLIAFKNQENLMTYRSRCGDLGSISAVSSINDQRGGPISIINDNHVKTKSEAFQ